MHAQQHAEEADMKGRITLLCNVWRYCLQLSTHNHTRCGASNAAEFPVLVSIIVELYILSRSEREKLKAYCYMQERNTSFIPTFILFYPMLRAHSSRLT